MTRQAGERCTEKVCIMTVSSPKQGERIEGAATCALRNTSRMARTISHTTHSRSAAIVRAWPLISAKRGGVLSAGKACARRAEGRIDESADARLVDVRTALCKRSRSIGRREQALGSQRAPLHAQPLRGPRRGIHVRGRSSSAVTLRGVLASRMFRLDSRASSCNLSTRVCLPSRLHECRVRYTRGL